MAFSRLKPTPMIRLQLSATMVSTFGLKSASELDSAVLIWMPMLDWAAFRPLYADSLKDLSSQPPASETAQALNEAASLAWPDCPALPPPPPQPAKASVATPAAAKSFVRCFMSVFLR